MRHHLIMCAALCGALVTSPAALSYSVQLGDNLDVVRWDTSSVSYWLSLAGSDNLPPEDALAAVRGAFGAWANVDCAEIGFVEQGDAEDPGQTLLLSASQNGKNEIVWVEDERWGFGRSVLGVTAIESDGEGRIVESDIAFNGLHVLWTVGGQGGLDLQGVALHEIGHFLGLQHNLGPFSVHEPPTMAPNVAERVKTKSLEPDDMDGLCFLYPRGGAWPCAGDEVCPWVITRPAGQERYGGRLHCGGTGTCDELELFYVGLSGLGERCPQLDSCREGLTCIGSTEGAVCTRACGEDRAPCPEALSCVLGAPPYDAQGVCLPAAPLEPGTGPDGCLSSVICAAGEHCLQRPDTALRACVVGCRIDEAADCGSGTTCWTPSGALGGCFDDALFGAAEPADAAGADASVTDAGRLDTLFQDTDSEDAASPPRRDAGCLGASALPLPWTALWCGAAAWLWFRRRCGKHGTP